nr:protein kinase, ATP binding site-containing protein [Tanacetum cinerariifolium]
MIIVSEYATNGSLDHYICSLTNRHSLTWAQWHNICLGAAKGPNYLHMGLGDDNRVVHRDVKSANILLDNDLKAIICDFGLSRSGPKNQPQTRLYTKAAGTDFYVDRIYRESGILLEAPILMINREDCAAKNTVSESMAYKEWIMFPPVTRVSNAPVNIEVAADSPHNMLLGRTAMQKMGILVLKIHGAIKFHIKKESKPCSRLAKLGKKHRRPEGPFPISKERIPSCDDTEEKIIVNDKYLEQMVTIEKQLLEHFKKELLACV